MFMGICFMPGPLPSAGQTKRKKQGFLLFGSLKSHAVTSIQIINNLMQSFCGFAKCSGYSSDQARYGSCSGGVSAVVGKTECEGCV